MREFIVICAVILAAAVVDVRAGSIYRRGRESELVQIPDKDIVSELRKDSSIPVEVDLAEPVLVIKDEVLVPVETLRNVEPIIAVDEPAPIINNIEDQIRGDKVIVEREDKEIQPIVEQQEVIVEADDGLRTETDDAVVLEQELPEGEAEAVGSNLKQSAEQSTIRPTLLQQAQQIITNPFNQFIDTIRRPSTKSPEGADGEAAVVEATTNANIFQQLQAGVQSIGNQITSAFVPPAQANLEAAESAPPQSSVRPPNFFETLQTNFQNTVGGIFNRPNSETAATGGATPQGPFQAVLSNVQNFLTGNRGEQNGSQVANVPSTPPKVGLPVDDKVDFSKNSDEVQEEYAEASIQPAQPLIELIPLHAQKGDDTVILVANESSLENESE